METRDKNRDELLDAALKIAAGADMARFEAEVYSKALEDITNEIKGSKYTVDPQDWNDEKRAYLQIIETAARKVAAEAAYHQKKFGY